ncbi:GNAT acetyltransferase [Microbacterium azadirachtae]|uniref:GNAT acetyltransferase n=2 Tax=Microbacterium azadirachtae TaxID=582680 RepID=A0A1I6G9E4_9MICO|nr:GNAT acetyltransferase [Microbacterium azadirachtae]SEF69153.1 GNAT acetyltransferase [Microbacterium azadirachtae]SEF69850.1 GNAT acetyltransferase [Microbacterium azadirachtae]SFR38798.1 GNAT acetyltransferase [Microbacterium azadirachtae]
MRLTGPTDESTAREGAAELAQVEVNVGFARAVLEGLVTGQLHTSESHAGAYHAVHPYGMSLIWGEGVGAAFDEIVAHLQAGRYRDRDEWLQIDPRWAGLPWERELTASPLRASVHERINFGFDPAAFDSAHGQAPEGWAIVPADSTDFAQPGAVVPREFWNDADQFLEHGGGWRAERAGQRGALAFTSFRFDDELEIGIETHPDARGKGLATAVAARMIDELLERGITPVWSCRASNHASVALAIKLGFTPARRLPYYGLAARRSDEP